MVETLQVWHSRLGFESGNSSLFQQLRPVKVSRSVLITVSLQFQVFLLPLLELLGFHA